MLNKEGGMPIKEAFSADRFRKIMALRGVRDVKSEVPSLPEEQEKARVLPEVVIVSEKSPSYMEYMEMYLDDCQDFKEKYISILQLRREHNDDYDSELCDAFEEAMDLRSERVGLKMVAMADKMDEAGLILEDHIEDYVDTYEAATAEEMDKGLKRKLKKNSKKINKSSKSFVKIGKKQIKMSARELDKLEKCSSYIEAKLEHNEDFIMTDVMRDVMLDYVKETHKFIDKDFKDYYRATEKQDDKEIHNAQTQMLQSSFLISR